MGQQRERGAAAVEVVGVVLLVVAVITTMSLTATPLGQWLGWKAECVVEGADEAWLEGGPVGGADECGPEPSTDLAQEDQGDDGPAVVPVDTGVVSPEDYDELCSTTHGYDAAEPCHTKDETCEYGEDGAPVGDPSGFATVWTVGGRTVLWTGCQAYTPPVVCSDPLSGWEQGTDLSDAEGFADWVTCVTGTTGGGPNEDPDTEECKDATPGSSGTTPTIARDEPKVQIGCTPLWVPKQCNAQWDDYLDWSGPAEQESDAAALKECVDKTLSQLEVDCAVWQKSQGKEEVHQFLFWEWSKSRAFVFEKMGDGTVRMHALHGSGEGNGISLDVVGGAGTGMAGVSFGAWVANGAGGDTTYEFRNLEDAQKWVDWYVEYEKADTAVADWDGIYDCYYGNCAGMDEFSGPEWGKRLNALEDQRSKEPEQKVLQVATSSSKKTTITAGAWFGMKVPVGKSDGGPGVGGTISHTFDRVVEERRLPENGKTVTTFSTGDATGGQIMAMMIGRPSSKSQPFATGGAAGEKTGSSAIVVLWNADGTVEHIRFRTSSATLARWSAEVGGHVSLPLGPFEIFNAGGYKTWGGAEGTESVVEVTIPTAGLTPEARAMIQAKAESLFPRDEAGNLDQSATLDFSKDSAAEYKGDILEEVKTVGGTRTLEYGVKEERDGGKLGLKVGPIKLWSSSWTDIDTEKSLDGSSLQYFDVNGESRTVDPAPKCKAPTRDTSGADYYNATGSDPVTSSHPDGQGYYRDRSVTPS